MSYTSRLESASGSLGEWLNKYRLVILVATLVATAGFLFQATNIKLDPGFEKSIPQEHPYTKTYYKYREAFGGANVVLIALMNGGDSVFSSKFMADLSAATESVLGLPGVAPQSVTSIFTPNVRYLSIDEEGFSAGPLAPPIFDGTAEQVDLIRTNFLKSKEVGRLISRDFTGALIRAEVLDKDPNTGQPLDYRKLSREIDAIVDKFSVGKQTVHVIGFPSFVAEVMDGLAAVGLFFLMTALAFFFMLRVYTGSYFLAGLVLFVSVSSVAWQLGIVEMLGYGLDPLSVLVPFLILAIAVSHAIQMVNTWALGVCAGSEPRRAALDSFKRLFLPGITAIGSTAVGFLIVMIIDVRIVQELGITAGVGVAAIAITNKFMFPVLLSYAPAGVVDRVRSRQASGKLMAKLTESVMVFTGRKSAAWAIAVALVTFALGVQLSDDVVVGDVEPGAPELRPQSTYNKDVRTIVNNFDVGLDELLVVAEFKENGCLDFEVMDSVDSFAWELGQTPGVKSVRALPEVLKARNVANNEGLPKFFTLNRNPESAASNMYNFELYEQLFDYSCSASPVRVFAKDHRATTLRAILARAEEVAKEQSSGVNFALVGGDGGVTAAVNDAVESSRMRMLILLAVATALITYMTFNSVRASLCVLFPLVCVAVVADAVMVILGIGLKVSTLPVVALGTGVGVDYGIYLFSRTYFYLRQGASLAEAYRLSLGEVGSAVVFTALTMTGSVLLWVFSPLKLQADMGVLLAYMFAVNMIAAIILVPAVAVWLFGERGRGPVGQKECLEPSFAPLGQ